MRGSTAKELSSLNERELINTKVMLFTNNRLETTFKETGKALWSEKFLTTPADKTKMYVIHTPNHTSTIDIKEEQTKVKNATVKAFFNYFLGEYNLINSYLNGDKTFREKIDGITTTDPKIFFNFAQFNIKSSLLWEVGPDGNYKLK